MLPKRTTIRLPAKRRPSHRRVHEDGEQSWAVSYADLLMVLLSFFVLFFSLEENQKGGVIRQIASLYEKTTGGSGRGPASENSSEANAPMDATQIAEVFKREGIAVNAQTVGGRLVLDLPENMYKPGSVKLKRSYEKLLEAAFDRLGKYSGQIDVVVVGHTDGAQVSRSSRPYLRDNRDLSAIRASRALRFAQKSGLKDSQLFAQGAGSAQRDTRSLSIIVQEKSEK